MARPAKERIVRFRPKTNYFKPRAVPLSSLEEVVLFFEEMESIRLCDLKGVEQEEAAEKMGVSQSTLQRILASARSKIAEALIKGKAIKIIRQK